MAKNFSILVFLLLGSVTLSHAQQVSEDILVAFRTGNAKQLSQNMSNNIDLTIQDKEGIYSRTQGELILKDFFAKHPPSSFQLIHQGTSKTRMHYAIGELTTSGGKTFRVAIYLKKGDSGALIQTLHIDPE